MELAATLMPAHHVRGVGYSGSGSAHGAAEHHAAAEHHSLAHPHPHGRGAPGSASIPTLAQQPLAHIHHHHPHAMAWPVLKAGPLRPVRAWLQQVSRLVRQPAAAARSRRRHRLLQQQQQQQTRELSSHVMQLEQGGADEYRWFTDGSAMQPTDAADDSRVATLESETANLCGPADSMQSRAAPGTLSQQITDPTNTTQQPPLGGWRERLRHRLQRTLQAWLARPACAVAGAFRPKGVGHNDTTLSERLLNVVSCAPFLLAGQTILRRCTSAAARRFGHCFLLVSGVAAGYHGSFGAITRRVMRLADYWSIAVASCTLRHAMYLPHSHAPCDGAGMRSQLAMTAFQAANLLAIPFAPSLVSSLNFALVEARCAWMALSHPSELALRWAAHALLGGSAGCLFLQESRVAAAHGVVPGWHAAWHLLSSLAIYTTTPFLLHKERLLGQSLGLTDGACM